MTNIFARKNQKFLPPAKRYEPWISIFEKKVGELQKEIDSFRKSERPYNLAKEWLALQDFPNETRLEVTQWGVKIYLQALPTNTKKSIDDSCLSLQAFLLRNKVYHLTEPKELDWMGLYFNACASFHLPSLGDIDLIWNFTLATGLADYEIQTLREEYLSYRVSYQLHPRGSSISASDMKDLTKDF